MERLYVLRSLSLICVFGAHLWVISEQFYLKVFGQQQLAGAQEAEDVTEDVSVSVDEVMLLQTIQHDGLGAVKQAADPAFTHRVLLVYTDEGRTRGG